MMPTKPRDRSRASLNVRTADPAMRPLDSHGAGQDVQPPTTPRRAGNDGQVVHAQPPGPTGLDERIAVERPSPWPWAAPSAESSSGEGDDSVAVQGPGTPKSASRDEPAEDGAAASSPWPAWSQPRLAWVHPVALGGGSSWIG